MSPLQTLRVAIRAILRNKLRSLLTALGIIVGVGVLIAISAVGEGAKQNVSDKFASMGSNLLIVLSGSASTGGSRGGSGSMPTLTWDDLQAIQNECSAVRRAAPALRTRVSVVSDEQNWSTEVQGTTPDFFIIREWQTTSGVIFTQADTDDGTKIAMLGRTVADKIFPGMADPSGATIRIKNIPFLVGGILAKKGQNPMGQDYDDVVVVPLKAYQRFIAGGFNAYINGAILVNSYSPEATARASTQVSRLLRDRHRLVDGLDDDFSVRNLTEMVQAQVEGVETVAMLLWITAAVSLLVGGIGIMNIMLVSVTERTREIGLRMAVGATPGQILIQFMTEALTLAVVGGGLGIAMGVGSAMVLAWWLGWSVLIRPEITLLAFGVSAGVGLVFGIYPAYRASRLDPIDALRYE